jgi:hypothetical protein
MEMRIDDVHGLPAVSALLIAQLAEGWDSRKPGGGGSMAESSGNRM